MSTEAYRNPYVVAEAPEAERASFIRRTYAHLAGAILAFIGLEFVLFQTPIPNAMFKFLVNTPYSWLIVMGAFMLVSWIAEKWAHSNTSTGVQYVGLSLYVVAQALIFIPLLILASNVTNGNIISNAAIITGLLFAGLTYTAFTTRKDFSFLGGFLKLGGFVAIGVILASIFFGFTLGLVFASVMVLFAAAAILYTTSNIIHHYGPNQHVAASLSLFASVALLFWYVIRILMSLRD